MKKITIGIAAALATSVLPLQASVVVGTTGNGDDVSRTITVTKDSATTAAVVGDQFFYSSGSFTGGAIGSSFGFTVSTLANWDAAYAADKTTFGGYVTNDMVAGVEIDNTSNQMGINSGTLIANGDGITTLATDPNTTRADLLGEAFYFKFNTSLGAGEQLFLDGLGLEIFTAVDSLDYVLYDGDTGFITAKGIDVGGLGVGHYEITDGDILILGVGASSVQPIIGSTNRGWRVSGLTLDVIPEPATLGLVAAFGGGILFIRRRFMI